MIKYIIFSITTFIFSFCCVNAQSFTNTNNMFDNSTSQQLLNIGVSRVDNFLDYNYVIFQNDTTYYMILFKDYTYNNNILKTDSSIVIRYYREGSGYNYVYTYDMFDDTSTIFTSQFIFISNLNINKSSSSPNHKDLLDKRNILHILMFIGAITFASFLLKERSSY